MKLPVRFADVEAAAERIADFVVRTPALPATALSGEDGREGHLEARDAPTHVVVQGPRRRQSPVAANGVGARTGRHRDVGGQPRAGRRVSGDAPRHSGHDRDAGEHAVTKVRRTQAFGARVVLAGEGLSEAGDRARELAEELGLTMVHPYDDVRIVAGQGTLGLELLRDVPDLDVLLVPIGGGGLISGVALAAKHLKPALQIVGVQTQLYPAFIRSRTACRSSTAARRSPKASP